MFEFNKTFCEIEHRSPKLALKQFTASLTIDNHFNPLIIKAARDGVLFGDDVFGTMTTLDIEYYNAVNDLLFDCQIDEDVRIVLMSIQNIYHMLENTGIGTKYYDFIAFSGLFSGCKIYRSKGIDICVMLDWIADNTVNSIVAPLPPSRIASPKIPYIHNGVKKEAYLVDFFYKTNSRPIDSIMKIFYGRQKIDMAKIGPKDSLNPFMEILAGTINDATFDNAWKCLDNLNFLELTDGFSAPMSPSERARLMYTPADQTKKETADKDAYEKEKSIQWSKEAYSKTVIGKVASGGLYRHDKSFRDFIDRKTIEHGDTIILKNEIFKKV